MKCWITLLAFFGAALPLCAQVNYTANNVVTPYTGKFRTGINMGYYPGWDNQSLADIAAGNNALNIKGIGAKGNRAGLYEIVLDYYGYTLNVPDFQHWQALGMDEFVAIVGGPTGAHQEYTQYCPGTFSNMFANLYTPIWDGGANGTPYNDNNYFAAYMYKVVSQYKNQVRFWEIWNEPGLDLTGNLGWRDQNYPGNWWLEGPNPCDNILHAPIYEYIRTLRIAWEIIKTLDPDSYVCLGSVGYQSLLNAILRNTDNPNNGDVSAEYPLGGGAYFDCISYHSYPHFDGSTTNFAANYFERHSDEAADGVVKYRDYYQVILDQYGYNGATYPKKEWIVTEINSPRKAYSGPFFGGHDAQINHMMKAQMIAKINKIHQLHTYQLFDQTTEQDATYEFHQMGLYKKIDGQPAYTQSVNDEGIALKTMSDLLFDTEYDPVRTAAMNLPAGVRGYAWKRPDGTYLYALWARTTIDLSEAAFATYSFPAAWNISGLTKYTWDYGYTGNTTVVAPNNIPLDARPVFFTVTSGPAPCQLTAEVSSVRCNYNGTSGTNADDTYSFLLTVTGVNTSGSWTATVNGQVFSGQMGVSTLIGPFLIANGGVNFQVNDASNTGCPSTVSVAAPAPCSVTGPSGVYCASQSDFPWHDWIAGVQTGSINNPSAKSAYTDYSNLSTNVLMGADYPLTLTAGFSWNTYPEYWRVWIDVNQDNVLDNNEIAFEGVQPAAAPGTLSATFNGQLHIPSGGQVGLARMRVSMKRGAYADPCEVLPFGEVEDYTVNITGSLNPCAITASVANVACHDNGTPTVTTDDTYTFSVTVQGTGTSAGWSASVNGQSVSGPYGAAVVFGPYPISSGNLSFPIKDNSNNTCQTGVLVTAPAPCSSGGGGVTVCAGASAFPWHEWIAQVQVGGFTQPSGKSAYSDFTGLNIPAAKGQSLACALTTGFSYDTYDEYWKIWIDYNHNGVLEEPAELAFSGMKPKPAAGTPTAVLNGAITIPLSALTGAARMRVSMKRGGYPTPCETLPFGEVEDYTVQIAPNLISWVGGNVSQNPPTDIAFFEALKVVEGARLEWADVNDARVSRFEVLHASDGLHWELLEVVPAATNLAAGRAYQYLHLQPGAGAHFYRIKSIPVNGDAAHSEVRQVIFTQPETFALYPNPAVGKVTADLSGLSGAGGRLVVFDFTGKKVLEQTVKADAGPVVVLSLDGLAAGQYYVQWVSDLASKTLVRKLVLSE